MFNNIVALGYGIIVFGILVGVGSVVLWNFGASTNECASDGLTWNTSTGGDCYNATSGDHSDPVSHAWTNTNYMTTQLGSSGLSGWVPAVIAISVGMLFLGYFAIGKGKDRY